MFAVCLHQSLLSAYNTSILPDPSTVSVQIIIRSDTSILPLSQLIRSDTCLLAFDDDDDTANSERVDFVTKETEYV